jgi:uncharacterized protein
VAIDSSLLDIVCCPVTQLPLQRLPAAQLERLNASIARREIKSRDGAIVTEAIEEMLVTRDGRLGYPVQDGIPVLLEDRGILLTQLDEG